MGLLNQSEEGINFANVQAPSFEALPAGWYKCAITDISMSESSSDSKKYPNCPMANVEFTVQEGAGENRRFWRNYLIHADFAGYLKSLFIGAGYNEDEVNKSDFDPEIEDLLGRQIDVKVNRKHDSYVDDIRNNVTGVAPAGTKAKGNGGSGGDLLP